MGQDNKEQLGTSSGSDATHGCGATEIVWKKGVDEQTKIEWKKYLQRGQRFSSPGELRSHVQKLPSLPKHNTVNYVYDQVPVPPASEESIGTQQPIEIRGRCTLATDVSAVAELGRTESEGRWHEEWEEIDDGVWQLTEWMLGEELWGGCARPSGAGEYAVWDNI